MKNLRLLVTISGGLAIATTILFACTDEVITTNPPEAGAPDSGLDQNNNQTDGSDQPDVLTDGQTFKDSGITLANYEELFAQQICRTLSKCCFGNANLDGGATVTGGTYDQASCVTFFKAIGFEGSSDEVPADKTNLKLDETKGNECLGRLENLTCDTPGPEYATLAKSCYAAVVGKVPSAGTCAKTLECMPGHFCSPTTNRCVAVRTAGGSCSDFLNDAGNIDDNASLASNGCSYRGRGVDTNLHCDVFNFTAGDYNAYTDWKCVANGDAGADCFTNGWCADSLCDDSITKCVTPKKFFAPTTVGATAGCGKFIKP